MLGHKLVQLFSSRYETWTTFRGSVHRYQPFGFFTPEHAIGDVDAFNFDTLVAALARARPAVVINCIGIIKQLPTATDPITSLTINALLPHRLAVLCRASGARLIHISTDCVFSGRRGAYQEIDISDAEDLYGRTKFLGEVSGPGSLTLRTSIIGRELHTTSGLVEWFLGQAGGQVRGFSRAIYTGFTTLELARVIAHVIDRAPNLCGLYQVSSEPINKYDLLCQLRDVFQVPVVIEPQPEPAIDRSLDSRRFRSAVGYVPPAWPDMLRELAQDPSPYAKWRTIHAT
jgi:dTDP-4-dehydrorhamnose reductase